MEDCDRALQAFGEVYAHGGKMVPGLASRNGHRNHIAGRNTDGWGGLRVRNVLVEESKRWLHPDAITVKEERTEAVLYNLTADDVDSSDDDE